MVIFPIQMYLLGDSHHTPTALGYLTKNVKITGHHPTTSSQAKAHVPSRKPTGRACTTSTADSGVGLQEQHLSKKMPVYGDLQKYVAKQQKHWLLARDVELVRPLQTNYNAYEADIMMQIRDTEDGRVRTYNHRWRDMRGATGPTKLSWKLYKLKVKLSSKWDHYQLHCRWKHAQLEAKKKELVEEYVRAQKTRRETLLREITSSADELSVDDRDDGGYLRDGMLNYILMGYESLFPISRKLKLGTEKRGWKKLSPSTHSAPLTLWDNPPPDFAHAWFF